MASYPVRRATAPADLAGAYALREEVFVREQGVPAELERDGDDGSAVHVIALDGEGRCVATGRLVLLGEGVGKVGRMAVAAPERGRGAGAAVLAELERAGRELGLAEVVLHAQLSARGFYDRTGYTAEGEVFEEAGIEHVTMRKRLG